MQVRVGKQDDWTADTYIRDEPYGDNTMVLKPSQIAAELIIAAQDWPPVRAQIVSLAEERI